MSCRLEPAIWSPDTGQRITCFDRCQFIVAGCSKKDTVNQSCLSLSTYLLQYRQYGRHVARLRRRAYAPTNNTASHDNHEKILHGFPFLSHDDYGAPLGGPLGRWSSAINSFFNRRCHRRRRRSFTDSLMFLVHSACKVARVCVSGSFHRNTVVDV